MDQLARRIARRHLLAAIDMDTATNKEVLDILKFMVGEVSSMSDADVAYGTYALAGLVHQRDVPGAMGLLEKMHKAMIARYRKNLIEWFKKALQARAAQMRRTKEVKKVEKGLQEFVRTIPTIILSKQPLDLNSILPAKAKEIFDPKKLNPIANKIIKSVWTDAQAAGVLPGQAKAAKIKLDIVWDKKDRLWKVEEKQTNRAHKYMSDLMNFGFEFNRTRRRYEAKRLPKGAQGKFRVHLDTNPELARAPSAPTQPGAAPSGSPEAFTNWYWGTWLPANVGRFSKVFSDFAKNIRSSYKVDFKMQGADDVKVQFHRKLESVADIIEELRVRYMNRHGREPWLEVMDRFTDLIMKKGDMMSIIDRINNLQHSNGLFMEHFPAAVQKWYLPFLNAKYHAPTPGALARYFEDRDLRDIVRWFDPAKKPLVAPQEMRDKGYDKMEKEMEVILDEHRKHKHDYPYYLLDKPIGRRKRQQPPERTDPKVQFGLQQIRDWEAQAEMLQDQKPKTMEEQAEWINQAIKLKKEYEEQEKTRAELTRLHKEKQLELQETTPRGEMLEKGYDPSTYKPRGPGFGGEETEREYMERLKRKRASANRIALRWLTRLAASVSA